MSIFFWRNNEALALRRVARPHYFLRKKIAISFEEIMRRSRLGGQSARPHYFFRENEHFFLKQSGGAGAEEGGPHASLFLQKKKWAFFFWRNAVALAGEKPTGVVPAAARAPHYPFRKNEHRPLMNWWIVFFWSKCKEGALHTAAGCQHASKRSLNKIISVFIEEIMRCWSLIWSEIIKVLWILRNQAGQPRNLFRQDA